MHRTVAYLAASAAASTGAQAAPTDPPAVSIEGTGLTVDANGVFLSPLDNPSVRVDMPLNVHQVSTPGGPNEGVVEAVARSGVEDTNFAQGAILQKFFATLTSTCAAGDLLCSAVTLPRDQIL